MRTNTHTYNNTATHLQRAVGLENRVEKLSDLADESVRLPVLRRHHQFQLVLFLN